MKLVACLLVLFSVVEVKAQSWMNSFDRAGLKYGGCLESLENAYTAAGYPRAFLVSGESLIVHTNNGAIAYSLNGSTKIGALSCEHNRKSKIGDGLSYLLAKLNDNRSVSQLRQIQKEIVLLEACNWVSDDSGNLYQQLRTKAGLPPLKSQQSNQAAKKRKSGS